MTLGSIELYTRPRQKKKEKEKKNQYIRQYPTATQNKNKKKNVHPSEADKLRRWGKIESVYAWDHHTCTWHGVLIYRYDHPSQFSLALQGEDRGH